MAEYISPKYVCVKDVARYFNTSELAIRALARKGLLPHFKVGKRLYFDLKLVDEYLAKRCLRAK